MKNISILTRPKDVDITGGVIDVVVGNVYGERSVTNAPIQAAPLPVIKAENTSSPPSAACVSHISNFADSH